MALDTLIWKFCVNLSPKLCSYCLNKLFVSLNFNVSSAWRVVIAVIHRDVVKTSRQWWPEHRYSGNDEV